MHVDRIWPQLLRDACNAPVQQGGEQGGLRQLAARHITLDGAQEQFLCNDRRRLSPVYASAELLWYLSREKSIEMISHYAPQYSKFAENGIAYGAYGARLANEWGDGDLLLRAITALYQKPSTKRCVVGIWHPTDLEMIRQVRDVPCTLSWQFLQHDGKLDMIVSMRSNDLWKGFLYDVYVNTIIHRYVCAHVSLPPGRYHHFAGSLHLYECDRTKAEEAIEAASADDKHEPYYPSVKFSMMPHQSIEQVLYLEEQSRKGKNVDLSLRYETALMDAMICCCCKNAKQLMALPTSPNLKRALEQMYG